MQETAVLKALQGKLDLLSLKTSAQNIPCGTMSVVPLVTSSVATYCFDAQCFRGQM